jgi:hypothetical protein
MKKLILRTRLRHIAYLLLAVVFMSCQDEKVVEQRNTEKVCKVLKAKHSENVSTNYRGDFEVVHYFLYEDKTLEEVSLKEFMMFDVSDTICWCE